MVYFEILIIMIGLIYGYFKPGKEDRISLLKKGILIGIILSIIFIVLGALMGGGMMILLSGIVSVVVFIEILKYTVLFIVGTLIGDWLEEKSKAKT
jgi:uncharacterized membrane protein